MAALRSVLVEGLAKAFDVTSAVLAPVSNAIAAVRDRVAPLLPLATRVFHVGFIPLVIFLGMRTEPRPALTDLLQPSARAAPRHAFFLAPCTRANRPHARNLPAQCESAARAGRPHAWRCFEEASWPGCGAAPAV